jgi:hypothetical protein
MAEDGGEDGGPVSLESYKYNSWEDVPAGGLRDALESVATGQPSSLALDTLVKSADDLAVLIKTLNAQAKPGAEGPEASHSVTTISMRYCTALRGKADCLELICLLCGAVWENEPDPGVVPDGPCLTIVETIYLDATVADAGAQAQITAAWQSRGHLHKVPEGEGMPFTLRRKEERYKLGGEERVNTLTSDRLAWVIEGEAANKPKKPKGDGKGKKKK